ncbi:GspH/FimT family pseudopilin [Thalassotalea ponticola]|uniref:GspH/FimT family pseudopilin n=1 Tax=Thalassotalea ponticola TaxID=1523392 RepID=UPI0025B30376|nr:GspH/FimT family pseudopilin [Thalassotalea ponticola]MDN3651706.1 GspH/FimT family pseudopilin [Thalassotalea ponticola]
MYSLFLSVSACLVLCILAIADCVRFVTAKSLPTRSWFRQRGVTLIELLVVITIIAILSTFALPSFKQMWLKSVVTAETTRWQQAFSFARQSAISLSSIVTLCPSIDGKSCAKFWHQGAIVFSDSDGNKQVSTNEHILYRITPSSDKIRLTWRAFQNRNYVQYQHNGFTWYQNGTLRLCVKGESQHYNRALIITRSGRIRVSKDSNGDGIHEDANGVDVQC